MAGALSETEGVTSHHPFQPTNTSWVPRRPVGFMEEGGGPGTKVQTASGAAVAGGVNRQHCSVLAGTDEGGGGYRCPLPGCAQGGMKSCSCVRTKKEQGPCMGRGGADKSERSWARGRGRWFPRPSAVVMSTEWPSFHRLRANNNNNHHLGPRKHTQ